jgi:hypothetical protein
MNIKTTQIPIPSIIFDEEIYSRKGVDLKRVNVFVENMRDGFRFDPVEVKPVPGNFGKYRLPDGVPRWNAYKVVGMLKEQYIYISLIFAIGSKRI